MLGLIGMLSIEAMAVNVQGKSEYLKDKWNRLDILSNVIYVVYFCIRIDQFKNIQDLEVVGNRHEEVN